MLPVTNRYNVLFFAPVIPALDHRKAILNHKGRPIFAAYSAGSHPAGHVARLYASLKWHTSRLLVFEARVGGIFNAGCAKIGFCFHGLRQRRERNLADLAGPAHDRALGHS